MYHRRRGTLCGATHTGGVVLARVTLAHPINAGRVVITATVQLAGQSSPSQKAFTPVHYNQTHNYTVTRQNTAQPKLTFHK